MYKISSEEIYNINEIYYSLYLSDLSKPETTINLYNPFLNGEIYQRYIPQGDILLFNGIINEYNINEITYGIISQYGLIEVYFDKCINFPLCDYNDEKLKNIKKYKI